MCGGSFRTEEWQDVKGQLRNQRMQEKLKAGECLDVRIIGIQTEQSVFQLRGYVDGVDYADAQTETWIWSIGRHKESGEIYAATDTRFYQHPQYDCLWLR